MRDNHRPPKHAKTPEIAAAEDATLRYLDVHDFESAARVVAEFEAAQPTPRGIGIDWRHYHVRGDIVALRAIYDTAPRTTTAICHAAAMMYLWGVSKPYRRWLSADANGDVVARSLVLHAFFARQADNDLHASEMFKGTA